MRNIIFHKLIFRLFILLSTIGYGEFGFCQTPTLTVRFANPQFDCNTDDYCLDVEFISSIDNEQLFGMNVRFFYDDNILELINFRDFVAGYGPVAPDPPEKATSGPAGPALFNFLGPAEFINGAIQLVNPGAPDVLLDTVVWVKIFQICFSIDDPNANLDTFCPPVVWDLEQDPMNGGFLAGDDGVVMTVVAAGGQSAPSNENVVQFNWEYIGMGEPPYGQPVELVCLNIPCPLPLTLLSFSGTGTTLGNTLDWETTNEYNVEGFGIQRSHDLMKWSTLDFISSAGNSINLRSYNYLDQFPEKGKNYYRLELRDIDGHIDYSNIIGIMSNEVEWSKVFLQVYPNPAKGEYITVSLSNSLYESAEVSLYDATGRLIRSQPMVGQAEKMEIMDLFPGMYIIRVSRNDQVLAGKFLIER